MFYRDHHTYVARATRSNPCRKTEATQQTMNVTAEHAGGAVVLELDEGCRSVAALRRIVCAALSHLKADGFDVTVQGRAMEDVDVCGLEEGAKIQVVVNRRVVALKALRAAGHDVSEAGLKDGIFHAVENGDVVLCKQYLNAGVSPGGQTLICRAVQSTYQSTLRRHVAVCKLLLRRGCDVNATDDSPCGSTALHLAACGYLPALCKLLLRHGADVNKRDRYGTTPLHAVRFESKRNHEVRAVLLRHGADMRARDNAGDSPLGVARRRRKEVVKPHCFSAFDLFVKYGAPPLTPRELGRLSNPDGRKYSRYIHKLAKVQFKKRKQQITWEGMGVVSAFVADVLERLGGEAGRVASFSGAKTLSVRSVVAAVKLQLPEELATHALAAGTAAVGRYAKACGGRR